MRDLNLQVSDSDLASLIEHSVKFEDVKHCQLDSTKRTQSYTISINSNAYLHCATEAKVGHHVVTFVKHTLVSGVLYVGLIAGLIAGFYIGLVTGLIREESEGLIYQMIVAGLAGAAAGVVIVAYCVAGESDVNVHVTAFDTKSIQLFAMRLFV